MAKRKRRSERERTQEQLARLIVKTGQSLDKLADAFAELQNTAAALAAIEQSEK